MSIFQDSEIPSSVTPDDALLFFETHGIFYQELAEAGNLARTLRGQKITTDHMKHLRPILMGDPRLKSVLAPFAINDPTLSFTLGSDEGNFYSLAIADDDRQAIAVFMWRPGAKLEFSYGSHIGAAIGVVASNRLFHRPYKHLSMTRSLKDVNINLNDGGILIVHPRLAFQVKSSVGIGFVCHK